MAHRLALVLLLLLSLAPSLWRRLAGGPLPGRSCQPEGRGDPPRHWIGCASDPGPRRALAGGERVLLGLRLDVNRASAEDLAALPGIGPGLATAIAADRERRGRFPDVESLRRVRGIGPSRLARLRPWLEVAGKEGAEGEGDVGGRR